MSSYLVFSCQLQLNHGKRNIEISNIVRNTAISKRKSYAYWSSMHDGAGEKKAAKVEHIFIKQVQPQRSNFCIVQVVVKSYTILFIHLLLPTIEVPVSFSDISMDLKDDKLGLRKKKVATSEKVRKRDFFSYFCMDFSETHDFCALKGALEFGCGVC